MRPRLCLVVALAVACAATALAATPQRSLQYLTTGNGFGFQVFDASKMRIKQFLERPYRYLYPRADPKAEGPVRRNLAFDVYFGLVAGGDYGWLPSSDTEAGYVEETNVMRSSGKRGAIQTEAYYFAPFGYSGNAMVMLLKATNTGGAPVKVDGAALFNFHMGAGEENPGAEGESVSFDGSSGVAVETGPGGGALIYVGMGVDRASCSSGAYNEINGGQDITPLASCQGNDLPEVFQRSLGTLAPQQSGWWGVAVLFEPDGAGAKDAALARWKQFVGGREPEALLKAVLDEWKSWRKPIPEGVIRDQTKDTAIWRQSEAVLRMGQVLEPWSESPKLKNHGMVLASLPPGQWHTGWVRDAQYAIVALARLGHCDESRKALEFFLNAEAGRFKSYVKNADYRISVVRYFGNGVEEADYSGQPTPNIETDGWGMFLWSARIHVDLCNDAAWLAKTTRYSENIYDVINQKVAGAMEANLEPSADIMNKDTSIWEVHMDKAQHFFYTSAAAARGFCDMATLALRAGKDSDAKHYAELAARVRVGIEKNFVDQSKILAGSLEKLGTGSQYRDGATVEAVTWDLVTSGSAIASATMNGFSSLKTVLGGYKRIEGSNDPYDTNEWILIDLRVADAFRRMGRPTQADALLAWVTDQAASNYNLLPELYDVNTPNGSYTGSIPMVGYGAGAYVITLLQRAGIVEPRGCAEAPKPPTEGPVRVDFRPAGDGFIDPAADGGVTVNPEATGFACLCKLGEQPPAWMVVPWLLLGLLGLAGWRLKRRR